MPPQAAASSTHNVCGPTDLHAGALRAPCQGGGPDLRESGSPADTIAASPPRSKPEPTPHSPSAASPSAYLDHIPLASSSTAPSIRRRSRPTTTSTPCSSPGRTATPSSASSRPRAWSCAAGSAAKHATYRPVAGRSGTAKLSQAEYYHHDGCSGPEKPRFDEIRLPWGSRPRRATTAVARFGDVVRAQLAALPVRMVDDEVAGWRAAFARRRDPATRGRLGRNPGTGDAAGPKGDGRRGGASLVRRG